MEKYRSVTTNMVPLRQMSRKITTVCCYSLTTFLCRNGKCSFWIRTTMFVTEQNVLRVNCRFPTTLPNSAHHLARLQWMHCKLKCVTIMHVQMHGILSCTRRCVTKIVCTYRCMTKMSHVLSPIRITLGSKRVTRLSCIWACMTVHVRVCSGTTQMCFLAYSRHAGDNSFILTLPDMDLQ